MISERTGASGRGNCPGGGGRSEEGAEERTASTTIRRRPKLEATIRTPAPHLKRRMIAISSAATCESHAKNWNFFPLADSEPGSPSCLARACVCVSRQTGGIKRPAPPNGSLLTPSIPRSGRKSNIAEHALPSPLHVVSFSALILSQREEERRAIDFAIKKSLPEPRFCKQGEREKGALLLLR